MPGRYDSSITRVAPVFGALEAAHHFPAALPRLLGLPERDGRRTRRWDDPGTLEETAWWPGEKRLDPPATLLEHLVRVLAGSGRTSSVPDREQLFAGSERALEKALAALRARRTPEQRRWYIFEGRTSVDAYIRTSRYIVLVEGKRTEAGPTTKTSWMKTRHQILRNIDAALDEKGRRRVVAFFAVEGREPDPTVVPAAWQRAVALTTTEDALAGSLPHRSEEERALIGEHFIGAVTWQAICREFALPLETLLPEVPSELRATPGQGIDEEK